LVFVTQQPDEVERHAQRVVALRDGAVTCVARRCCSACSSPIRC
jgi:ABC-type molybdate transport system ATPase subunit